MTPNVCAPIHVNSVKKYQVSKLKTIAEIINRNNTRDFTWKPYYVQGKTTGKWQL